MGVALYDNKPFRIDPGTVQGSFEIKTSATETIGGRVVQVYGVKWDDIIISGSFGRGAFRPGVGRDPYQDQLDFLDRMESIMERQAALLSREPPQRFYWPDRGWDFQVYLKEYSTPDGSGSVAAAPEIFAPNWTLTLFVVTDNGQLSQVIQDDFIARLSKGLGWKQTIYNGPIRDFLSNGALFNPPGQTPTPIVPFGSGLVGGI